MSASAIVYIHRCLWSVVLACCIIYGVVVTGFGARDVLCDVGVKPGLFQMMVLSDASMSSDWVLTELLMARDREKKEKVRILLSPIPFAARKSFTVWARFLDSFSL